MPPDEEVSHVNYTIFAAGQSFARPLAELATALRQDVEWVREHTRLGEQAARWKARGQAEQAGDLLLRGSELTDARAWIARRRDDAPDITDLQRAFLSASEVAEESRFGAELQRLAERERLVNEAETAQAHIRKLQRWSYAVLALMLGGVVLGLWQIHGFWKNVMLNRAEFIASQAEEQSERANDPVTGMLLGARSSARRDGHPGRAAHNAARNLGRTRARQGVAARHGAPLARAETPGCAR